MSGVKATNETVEINNTDNQTYIFINRQGNAEKKLYTTWNFKHAIHWSKYQIKETDMRVKTATFTSNTYLDLTTGVYQVLITSPYHEDFGGIILSVDKDMDTGLYNYQCQDFSRLLQTKPTGYVVNVKLHRLLKYLITRGGLSLSGDISKVQKNWKDVLSGLKPAYAYDQEFYNSIVKFNPMTTSQSLIMKDKSNIELIRILVFGTGAYIDVYFNKYGILQIEPYDKLEWLNNNITIPFESVQDMKLSFDTTNIITNVTVNPSEALGTASGYDSIKLFGFNLVSMFGQQNASIQNPNKSTSTTSKKSTTKKTTTATKKTTGNPYKTKKKKVYLNSDNIDSKSTDKKFLKDIGKLLKKQGWSYKVVGVGSNVHTETYARKYKNGVWFCVYGGADGAVFRECSRKNSYTNILKKNNLRTVIGMKKGCDIRKGGKCYKWLRRAHDDNYSPSSYKGVSYPLKMLTKAKVPIMYAGTPKKMVAKFLKGGDNPKAC